MASAVDRLHQDALKQDVLIQCDNQVRLGRPGEAVGENDLSKHELSTDLNCRMLDTVYCISSTVFG